MAENNNSINDNPDFIIENFTWNSQIFNKITCPFLCSIFFYVFTGSYFIWLLLIFLLIILYHLLFQKIIIFRNSSLEINYKFRSKNFKFYPNECKIIALPMGYGGIFFVKLICFSNDKILKNRIHITKSLESKKILEWAKQNQVAYYGPWEKIKPTRDPFNFQ